LRGAAIDRDDGCNTYGGINGDSRLDLFSGRIGQLDDG
jgi:hypothetical protein